MVPRCPEGSRRKQCFRDDLQGAWLPFHFSLNLTHVSVTIHGLRLVSFIFTVLYIFTCVCVFPFHSHCHKAQSEDFPIQHNVNATGRRICYPLTRRVMGQEVAASTRRCLTCNTPQYVPLLSCAPPRREMHKRNWQPQPEPLPTEPSANVYPGGKDTGERVP